MVFSSKSINKNIQNTQSNLNISNEIKEPTKYSFKMILNKIIFKDDVSNFFVASATLAPNEEGYQETIHGVLYRDRTFTIVGTSQVMCSLEVGQEFRTWGTFGPGKQANTIQFNETAVQELMPTSLKAIEHFLSSGKIPGIGAVLAKRISAMFGERTIEVLDVNPDELLKVQGLNLKKLEGIKAGWKEYRDIYDIISTMILYDVGDVAGMKIYNHFKEKSLEIIKEDPYALTEVESIGFKTADKIATSNGVAPNDPKRIEKCILFLLEDLGDNGHTAFPLDEFREKLQEFLKIEMKLIDEKIHELIDKNQIISRTVRMKVKEYKTSKFFYRKKITVVAHKKLYNTEMKIAAELKRLATAEDSMKTKEMQKEIDTFLALNPFDLDDSQIAAAETILNNKVSVLTGGPGTGKTHTLKSLLHFFKNAGRIVEMVKDPASINKSYQPLMEAVLSAPTGRAAKRMNESTQMESSTIHRLLKFSEGAFEHNELCQLQGDVFIVDESSMVDVYLASALLRAIPSHARLIIVGDFDQLSSVGPGDFLKNIINSKAVAVARLKKIHRQAEGSDIILAAHDVINEKVPKLNDYNSNSDFVFVETPHKDEVEAYDTVLDIVRHLVQSGTNVNNIQVLTPKKESLLGVFEMNKALRFLLNPEVSEYESSKLKFIPSDRVMQLKNQAKLNIYNGDVGFVKTVDEEDGTFKVNFDGNVVDIEGKSLNELILAYASTIHKSQGSDYPYVIIPIVASHSFMWDINLLYTAITRGKKRVILVGDKKTLSMSVATFKQTERVTCLRELLMEEFEIVEDESERLPNEIAQPTNHDIYGMSEKRNISGFNPLSDSSSKIEETTTKSGFKRKKVSLS